MYQTTKGVKPCKKVSIMQVVSATTNGNQAGVVWLNDHNGRTSKLVNVSDMGEICGFDVSEFDNLTELNAELYEFTFSTSPVYEQ